MLLAKSHFPAVKPPKYVCIGLSIDEWGSLTWPGWGKKTTKNAWWLANLSLPEKIAFKKIILHKESPQKLYRKCGLGNYSVAAIENLARRAAKKLYAAFTIVEGQPVSPQVFLCWIEDVFRRPIYRPPSHSRRVLEGRGRSNEE